MSDKNIIDALNKMARLSDELSREDEERWGVVCGQPILNRDHVPCKWCGGGPASGRGCTACSTARLNKLAELDEEYKRQFPDGPQPILSVPNTPEGWEKFRKAVGKEAMEKAFGPGVGGIQEIEENCKRVNEEKQSC